MSQQKLDKFIISMNSINYNNANKILSTIYTDDVEFVDPVKTIRGLDELTNYFEKLYKSVDKCQFILNNHISNKNSHSLEWMMNLQHKKISKNREIQVDGISSIQYQGDKVCYHRDYYDLGAMVYEHLPLVGTIIKKIRHAI